jgi:hypothetical protein
MFQDSKISSFSKVLLCSNNLCVSVCLCVQCVCTVCVYSMCVQYVCTVCVYSMCVQYVCTICVYIPYITTPRDYLLPHRRQGCANDAISDFHIVSETADRPRMQCGHCSRLGKESRQTAC